MTIPLPPEPDWDEPSDLPPEDGWLPPVDLDEALPVARARAPRAVHEP